MDFLKRRKDVDPARIAMLGYGEGGAVASVAASRGGSIAALVLVAAPGVTGGALALEQQTLLLARLNTPEAERSAKLQLQQKLYLALITGTGLDAVPADLVRRSDTPWFRSFLVYDPAKVVKNVRQPILIVHGELDREIVPANADKLAADRESTEGPRGRSDDAGEDSRHQPPAGAGANRRDRGVPQTGGSHGQPGRHVRNRSLAEGSAEGQVGCGRFRPRGTTGRRSSRSGSGRAG